MLLNTVLPYSQTQKIVRKFLCQAPYLNTTLQLYCTRCLWQPRIMGRIPTYPEAGFLFEQQHGLFIDINLKTGAYDYDRPNGTRIDRASGFNGAVLADWLAPTGINTSDQHVRDLCNAVYQAMNEIPQGNAGKSTPLKDQNGRQVGIASPANVWIVHDEPSPVLIGGLVLLWIGVWIYGIRRVKKPR